MTAKIVYICSFFAILSSALANSCNNPQITSNSFTTQDATIVANIAYVSEFVVKCDSGIVSNLYADVNGIFSPVTIIGSNKYQVCFFSFSVYSLDFTLILVFIGQLD